MEAWRSDWDELQKAINGNTIDDALIQKLLTSHRRSSPTKFVVSEEQMYRAQNVPAPTPATATATAPAQTPPRKQSPSPEPEPEPEWERPAMPEGVPPSVPPGVLPGPAARALLPVALDSPAGSAEQRLLSSILREPRPASVAPMPTHDSAEQDLLRRTGLARPAAAAGVQATHTAGRELGVSGDVVTVAFRKVYDPLAMPGIARPTTAITEQLSRLLDKSHAEPTSPTSQRRAIWASRGWARDSTVANGALSSIIGPSPAVVASTLQESYSPAEAATSVRTAKDSDSVDSAVDLAPGTGLNLHDWAAALASEPQPPRSTSAAQPTQSADGNVESGPSLSRQQYHPIATICDCCFREVVCMVLAAECVRSVG